jgi:hypothetical protein
MNMSFSYISYQFSVISYQSSTTPPLG